MSSRALKKLSLHGDSDIFKVEENSSNVDDDVSGTSFKKGRFNRYNLVRIKVL